MSAVSATEVLPNRTSLNASKHRFWQEAQRKDFLVSDGDVALALEQVKKNYDSEQAFLNKIKEGGFNIESYTEDLKRQLSVRRLVTEGIAPATTVSDQEVEEFYTANPDKMQRPEELRARHILIKLAPDADPAAEQAAKAQIDKVLAEARAGADFAELATQHSQAPSAPQGGDLGFFGPGKMVPPFEQAAFALAPNEISEVVRTQFGYHIIRLEERRGGETLPKEAVAPQIRSYLTQQKVQQGVQDLVQDLRASGNVEVLLGN
ncbi:MAG: peptidylprolyl isomerase [Gammaproteobacteria bacterium]|nr:peptidylprolyl isomerase [Gammaproteobacteria bacterium]